MNREIVRLTPRGRHAVMAMTVLAHRYGMSPVPLAAIAKTGNISLSYLEQIFTGLRKAGLVRSHRGPGGGYVLALPVSRISVASILLAVEKSRDARRERKAEQKETDDLWDCTGRLLHACLKHVSLEDVVSGRLCTEGPCNKLFEALDRISL